MPNLSIDEIRDAMYMPKNIRNVSLIAQHNHGKTTLTDFLIAKAGITVRQCCGEACYTDPRDDEYKYSTSIKPNNSMLSYDYNFDVPDAHTSKDGTTEKGYLINLLDPPQHADFSPDTAGALRLTDGALIIADYVQGMGIQTECGLRQALGERIKPVLFINKIDRGILERMEDGESMYQNFMRVIEGANAIISPYENGEMGEPQLVEPGRGTVAFGSALFGWAFSITNFGRIYSQKFKIDQAKMMQKLWGENYFDPSTKRWKTESISDDGRPLKRSFVQFIMEPIIRLCRGCMDSSSNELVDKMIKALDISLTQEQMQFVGTQKMKCIFQKWINMVDILIEIFVLQLPSPVKAQQYRAAYLYEGPISDACGQAIQKSDYKGPVMVLISKLVPTSDKGRFYSLGRVFSGTIYSGQKVRIMGPNYKPGTKQDLKITSVTRTVIMMCGKVESVPDVPCGNLVALVGVDRYIKNQCTISDDDDAHLIRAIKYSVSPVVRIAVEPKNPADLPWLVEGLKKLSQADQTVQCITEETGQHLIAGSSEWHIEAFFNDLANKYAFCGLKKSDPMVIYKETVTTLSSQICMAKSPNKHNRIFMQAEPLGDDLANDIDNDIITSKMDSKEFVRLLSEKHSWDKNDALKIWCFGPDTSGPNILFDKTQAIQNLSEIKDSITSAFQWATKEGALTEEEMRGIKFNFMDVSMQVDAIHRGGGQIIPTARRVYYGAQLTASPRLVEPVFLCEIQTHEDGTQVVYELITQRTGFVINQEVLPGTPLVIIKSFLPVAESFGFTHALRVATSGKAFPQCLFDHWELVPGDPYQASSKAGELVAAIRKRKGLKEGIPELEKFIDTL
ncbi:hypothetical protein FGO68_gene7440 [Halteria grandinella]|uniref:Tr-type G domain-containing protein n=1 Tax=Halteria grandinella TaxID=5974 RepID=A0A8J8NYE1_HALGN|nr:hypothetical protein FGO68_gene7440 [Halteria grandinella]